MNTTEAAFERKESKKLRLDPASIAVERLKQVKDSKDLALVLEGMKTLSEHLNMHFQDKETIKTVISCRILDLVVEIMDSFNESWRVAYFGCDILSSVLCGSTSVFNTENLLTSSDIQDAGVPATVLKSLSIFENHYNITTIVLEAIGYMIEHHCRFSKRLGLQQRIVSTMSYYGGSRLQITYKSCEIIRMLCYYNSREVQIFTDLGVCPLVFHALVDHYNNSSLQDSKIVCVLRALESLLGYNSRVIFPRNQALFRTMGICGVLYDISTSQTSSCRVRLRASRIRNVYFLKKIK
jgi:hypothetical protein